MLPADELRDLLNSGVLPVARCKRTCYRCVEQGKLYGLGSRKPYINPIPLYPKSSVYRGARFTPKGGPDTLYLSEDVATAYLEVDRAYRKVEGLEPTAVPRLAPPVVLFQVRTELQSVLDLTDESVKEMISTSTAELTDTWRLRQLRQLPVPTQILGKAVFDSCRYQAIRYASARDTAGKCLAIFPERLAIPASVEVFDPYGELVGSLP